MLEKYPAYDDSTKIWSSALPVNWRIARVKQVGLLKGGNGFPEEFQDTQGDIPFYKVKNLIGSKVYFDNADHHIDDCILAKIGAKKFQLGTIVFAKVGAALLLHRFNFLPKDSCIDNNMMGLTVTDRDFDYEYMYYQLHLIDFTEFVNPGAVPSITGKQVGNVHIFKPPLRDQKCIAAFLRKQTRALDSLIDRKIGIVRLLKEKRQTLITQAVTKGLNPDVPMKNSGVEWIGEIPEHWEVKSLKFLATIQQGQVDPKVEPYKSMILIAPNHIESKSGKILGLETADEQGADSGKYFVRKGDVVYSKIRPELAKACIAPSDSLCSADMYPIRTSNKLLPCFLFRFILTDNFTSNAKLESNRVAMPKVNREFMTNCPFVQPPLNEQELICQLIDEATNKIDSLTVKISGQIGLLQEYRQSLITSAVTGKIDIRNWSPKE